MASRASVRLQCIRDLEDKQGRITAEKLVTAASNPRHPMHRDFLWDDAAAGHQHRLNQARTYIAAARAPVVTSTKKVVAPYYIRDPKAIRQGYMATAKLKTDREASEEALLYETARLQAQLERCREIAAALELEDQLELILEAVKTMEGRIRRGSASVHLDA